MNYSEGFPLILTNGKHGTVGAQMVPVLYVIAAGLALWGVVVILSGDLVAMLDIATGLFGSAAVVAGLAAVAGALNRIARTINRITVEATDLQDSLATMPTAPLVANRHDATPYVEQEIADSLASRDRKREARARRKGRPIAEEAAEPEPEPFVPPPPPITEERLGSGARAWVERRDTPEHYAPRRRLPEAEPFMPPAPQPEEEPEQPPAPSSEVVRSGTLNGVLYRFYADGSVEAVTPTGLRRFRSMEELRETILAARGSGSTPAAAPSAPERPAPPAPAPQAKPPATPAPAGAVPPVSQPGSPPAPAAAPPPEQPAPTPPEPADDRSGLSREERRALREARRAARNGDEARPAGAAETESAAEPEPAAPPSPPAEEQLTPEKRLELFQQNIWATTLAELRRPLDAARKARGEEGGPPGDKERGST